MNDSLIIEEEPSVETRLRVIKRSVRKMTQEALNQSRATNLYFDDDDESTPLQSLSSSRNSDRPGIELELFGQDTSVIEKHVLAKLNDVEAELQEIVSDLQDEPTTTAPSLDDFDKEATALKTKISFLQECSKARAFLDESVTLSNAVFAADSDPDLAQAAQQLMAAQQSLSKARDILMQHSTEDQENNNSKVLAEASKMLDALDTSARRQKIHLIGRAKTLWQTSVEVTPNYILVRESNSSSKSALKTAYDTLEVFQAEGNKGLEDVLKTFTKSLYDDVVSTLLKKHQANQVVGEWTFRETEEKNRVGSSGMAATTSRGPTWRLEWMCDTENNPTETMSPSADTSMSVTAWEGTFGFMERILGFVAQRVLLGREPLCHWTGNRFFGKPEACLHSLNLEALGLESRRLGNDNGLIMEPLIDALNASCIPASLQSDELGRLTNMSADLGRFIHSFLSTMQDSLLISAPAETRLAKFISSFEQNYIDKRRCVILNQARDLLMQNDYHNTVQVGVEVEEDLSDIGKRDRTAAFKLHKASVSVTSSELIKLCRKTMDEAVQQQVLSAESALAVLSASLYRASRETLDLFRAIIPTAHGYIIKNLPRTAAVFHNDCVFLAHHCLTLGLEYREKFPPVDEGNLQGTLLRQTCMFVDMVPLFRDLAERSLGDMLELQANQIVETVGQRIVDLGRSLESNEIVVEWSEAETGLTAGVYHLRHLLQAWQTVLSKEILNSSMWYLCDVVLTLFLNQVFNARDISASACQFSSTLFRRATDEITDLVSNDTTGSRVWDRFSAVSTFFDMNLNDIEIALADGVFIEITGQELTRLIVATFDDSPKRRELVAALVSP